jgi:predicted RNA-binding Zn-ribbon protein involved in translation (DUF1610 family)
MTEEKVFDAVDRTCPACGGVAVFRLEETSFQYGEDRSSDKVQIKYNAIIRSCTSCDEEFTDWQNETLRDTAIRVFKESKEV